MKYRHVGAEKMRVYDREENDRWDVRMSWLYRYTIQRSVVRYVTDHINYVRGMKNAGNWHEVY